MSVHMQPARVPQGEAPEVQNLPVAGTETWEPGTVLKNVSGEWSEVTVDTDNGSLEAVSLEGCENGTPDGPADEVAAALITDDTYFICEVWDGSAVQTDLSTLTVRDQGDLDVNSDIYRYDSSSNSSAALEIVDIFDDHDLVLVEFISSVVA